MENRREKKARALAAMREQSRGKVAVCPSCNKWFGTYKDRNEHRAKCPKRRNA